MGSRLPKSGVTLEAANAAAFVKQLQTAEKAFDSFRKTASKATPFGALDTRSAAQAFAQLQQQAVQAGRGAGDGFSGQFGNSLKGMDGIVSGFFLGLGNLAANAFVSSFGKVGSQIQAGLSDSLQFGQLVADITAITGDVSAAARDMIADSVQAAATNPALFVNVQQAGEVARTLLKTGQDVNDVTDGLLQEVILLQNAAGDASGALTDYQDAASITGRGLQLFGLGAQDANQFVQGVTATLTNSAIRSLNDYSYVLLNSGQAIQQLKLNTVEYNAAIIATSASFSSGRTLGTAFEALLTKLANTTDDSREALKELGVQAFDAQGNFVGLVELQRQLQVAQEEGKFTQQELLELYARAFGSVGSGFATAIANAQDLNTAMQTVKNTSAEAIASIRTDTAQAAFNNLLDIAEASRLKLVQPFTDSLQPALVATSTLLQSLADEFDQFGERAAGVFGPILEGYTDFVTQLTGESPAAAVAESAAEYVGKTQERVDAVNQNLLSLRDNLIATAEVTNQISTADALTGALETLGSLSEVQQGVFESQIESVNELGQAYAETGAISDEQAAKAQQLYALSTVLTDSQYGLAQAFAFTAENEQFAAQGGDLLLGQIANLAASYQAGQISAGEYAGALQYLVAQLLNVAQAAGISGAATKSAFGGLSALAAAQRQLAAKAGDSAGFAQGQQRGQVAYASARNQAQERYQEQQAKAQTAANKASAKAAKEAAKSASAIESALGQIEGVFKASQVTEEDMRLSEEGLYQEKADEFLRRLGAAAESGGKEFSETIGQAQEALARVGVTPSGDLKTLYLQTKEAWESGLLFYAEENKALVNEEAIKAAAEMKRKAQIGRENMVKWFGDLVDGLVEGTAEGLGATVSDTGVYTLPPVEVAVEGLDPLTGIPEAITVAIGDVRGGGDNDALTATANALDETTKKGRALTQELDNVKKKFDEIQGTSDKLDPSKDKSKKGSEAAGIFKPLFDQLDIFDEKMGFVAGIFTGLNEIITGITETIQGQDFTAAGTAVSGTLTTVLDTLTKLTELSDIGTTTSNLSEFVQAIYDAAGQFAEGIDGEEVAGSASKLVITVTGKITETIDNVKLDELGVSVTGYLASISGLFVETINGVKFEDIGSAVGTMIGTLANEIVTLLADPEVGKNLGETAGNFVSVLVTAVQGAFDLLTGALTGVDDTLDVSALTGALDTFVGSFVQGFIDAITRNFTNQETGALEITLPSISVAPVSLEGATQLTDTLNPLALALTGASIAVGLVDQAIKNLAQDGGALDLVTGIITQTLDTITNSIKEIDVGAVGGALNDTILTVTGLFVTLSEIPDLGPITSSVGGLVTALLDLATGSVLKLDGEQIGGDVSEFASNIVKRLAEGIKEVPLTDMAIAAANLVGALAGTFRDAFTVDNLAGVGKSAGELVTGIVGKLAETLSNPEFGESLGTAFGDIVVGILQGTAGLLQGFGEGLDGETFGGVGDAIFTFIDSFFTGLAKSLATADYGEIATSLLTGLKDAIVGLTGAQETITAIQETAVAAQENIAKAGAVAEENNLNFFESAVVQGFSGLLPVLEGAAQARAQSLVSGGTANGAPLLTAPLPVIIQNPPIGPDEATKQFVEAALAQRTSSAEPLVVLSPELLQQQQAMNATVSDVLRDVKALGEEARQPAPQETVWDTLPDLVFAPESSELLEDNTEALDRNTNANAQGGNDPSSSLINAKTMPELQKIQQLGTSIPQAGQTFITVLTNVGNTAKGLDETLDRLTNTADILLDSYDDQIKATDALVGSLNTLLDKTDTTAESFTTLVEALADNNIDTVLNDLADAIDNAIDTINAAIEKIGSAPEEDEQPTPESVGATARGGYALGKTLVGEEGPELAYDPVTASSYLIGKNGPEIRDFDYVTHITPAGETSRILGNVGDMVEMFNAPLTGKRVRSASTSTTMNISNHVDNSVTTRNYNLGGVTTQRSADNIIEQFAILKTLG